MQQAVPPSGATLHRVHLILANTADEAVKAACQEYLDTYNSGVTNGPATDKLVAALEGQDCGTCQDIVKNKDFLSKKSQWVFGGDGWAYDIGFGGVDHILASGKDINVMVFNTEVYSNTGGQASKATPTVKAIAEAEAYPGPSLIIAYAPCINHGIKKGMSKAQTEEKLAVETGYWNMFRFNPAAEKKFVLDSKVPTKDFQEFIGGEVRYTSLALKDADKASRLQAQAAENAKERYEYLQKLQVLYGDN